MLWLRVVKVKRQTVKPPITIPLFLFPFACIGVAARQEPVTADGRAGGRSSLHDAGDAPRVRAGAAGAARRGRYDPSEACRLLSGAGRGGRARIARAAATTLVGSA